VPLDFENVDAHQQQQQHFAGVLRDVEYVHPAPARPACLSICIRSRISACPLRACACSRRT
jgi:hypothetical protein